MRTRVNRSVTVHVVEPPENVRSICGLVDRRWKKTNGKPMEVWHPTGDPVTCKRCLERLHTKLAMTTAEDFLALCS